MTAPSSGVQKAKTDASTKASQWSLRFENHAAEAAYLSRRREELFLHFHRISILLLFIMGSAAVMTIMQGNELTDPQWITTAMQASMSLLSLSLSVVSRFKWVQKAMSFRTAERICLGLLMLVSSCTVLLDDVFLDAMFFRVFSLSDTERMLDCARVAMGLNALVTVSHFALPIRWFLMVWLDMYIFVLYTLYVLMVVGAVANFNLMRFGVLTFFTIIGCCQGLRFLESNARKSFFIIVDERSRHATAEFNLSLEIEKIDKEKNERSEAEESLPSTTQSTRMLKQAALRNQAWQENVQSLGEKEGWLIKKHELAVSQEVVGSGGCSKVLKGTFCRTPVACKIVKSTEEEQQGNERGLCNELELLRRLRHPNIVLFHGACFEEKTGSLIIVLELIHGKMLDSVISRMLAWKPHSPNALSQTMIMSKICRALIYLHSRTPCIVHGDLKPNNILVEKHFSGLCPKLIDFGLSRKVTRNSETRGGTPVYMAPELMLTPGQRPRPDADVYSMGLLMYYISTSRRPHTNLSADEVISKTRLGTLSVLVLLPTTALFDRWRETIEKCLSHEASSRPTAQVVHDFLAQKHVSDQFERSYNSISSVSSTISRGDYHQGMRYEDEWSNSEFSFRTAKSGSVRSGRSGSFDSRGGEAAMRAAEVVRARAASRGASARSSKTQEDREQQPGRSEADRQRWVPHGSQRAFWASLQIAQSSASWQDNISHPDPSGESFSDSECSLSISDSISGLRGNLAPERESRPSRASDKPTTRIFTSL